MQDVQHNKEHKTERLALVTDRQLQQTKRVDKQIPPHILLHNLILQILHMVSQMALHNKKQ